MRLNQSLRIQPKQFAEEDSVGQAAYFEILKKLDTYKSYAKGWDGEDASPLTEKVISNFNLILDRIDKRLLVGLTIYPETNGTLLIDSTKHEAALSLGEKTFSCYEIANDDIIGEDSHPFTAEAVIDVISRISR